MRRNGFRYRSIAPQSVNAARVSNRVTVIRLPKSLCFILLCALMLSIGCSSLQNTSESIVRVETKQNTARANRLTYAGIRSLNKGEIDLAAKRFREAVEADFAYGPAHNNLGLMHYEQGNLYQAVMAFEQAREFMPNDPAVVYNLGLALESAGRIDEALDLYYTATEMDQANPNFLGNLVRLRVRMGEQDEELLQQLEDLVLIETRPDWRRWADSQLGLTMNLALDRGPETPDLENAANDASEGRRSDIQDKIIDLTPIATVSAEEDISTDFVEDPLSLDAPEPSMETSPVLQEEIVDDLSEDAYYRSQ